MHIRHSKTWLEQNTKGLLKCVGVLTPPLPIYMSFTGVFGLCMIERTVDNQAITTWPWRICYWKSYASRVTDWPVVTCGARTPVDFRVWLGWNVWFLSPYISGKLVRYLLLTWHYVMLYQCLLWPCSTAVWNHDIYSWQETTRSMQLKRPLQPCSPAVVQDICYIQPDTS